MSTTDVAKGRASRALAAPELLQGQLEPVHAASSSVAALSLLPAIQVAWADGEVQAEERELILRLAREHGLMDDAAVMAKINRWLEVPPSDAETREAIAELRGLHAAGSEAERREVDRVVGWARAVAKASGGILGAFAVSDDERREIERFEAALAPGVGGGAQEHKAEPASRLKALEVMRDLLLERLNADTEHIDLVPPGRHPQWPQPSPRGANFPPAVFGIPESDYRDYMEKVVARYVKSLTLGWRDALHLAAATPGVARIDDHEFSRLMFDTPFARFLVPAEDPKDAAQFSHVPGFAGPAGGLYKADFTPMAVWKPLPGLTLAGAVGLFRLEGERLVPLAIGLDGKVFTPEGGQSWARARCFLLQCCSVSLVIGVHPLLHFPMDSVIAVSREALPREHPVARLVEAHSYLHLPLDYGVCWNARSAAHNHQSEIYTALPARRDDVFGATAAYYGGIPGNAGYPGFRFPLSAPVFPGQYCRFLRDYHEVVLAFCRRVAAACPADDPALAAWGEALHRALPGFPSAAALRDGEVLARTLCGFVHSVAVWHSSDHYAYSQEPVNKVPQRLRVPLPTGDDAPIPLSEWMRPVDLFRQEVARRLFYEAHTVRSILEVDYQFDAPALRQATSDFHEALRACDRAQPKRYIPLERMACSIQF